MKLMLIDQMDQVHIGMVPYKTPDKIFPNKDANLWLCHFLDLSKHTSTLFELSTHQ